MNKRIAIVTVSSLMLAACQQGATYQQNPKTYQGAATGAAIGGVLGSLESSEYAAGFRRRCTASG